MKMLASCSGCANNEENPCKSPSAHVVSSCSWVEARDCCFNVLPPFDIFNWQKILFLVHFAAACQGLSLASPKLALVLPSILAQPAQTQTRCSMALRSDLSMPWRKTKGVKTARVRQRTPVRSLQRIVAKERDMLAAHHTGTLWNRFFNIL